MNSTFYTFDLADIHDTSFDTFAKDASVYIIPLLKNLKRTNLPVIELGSGSGIFSDILFTNGFKVEGVDYSEDMVEIARKKLKTSKFHITSLWDFPIPSCCAVVAVGECLNYMVDRKVSLKDLYELFERISNGMELDGLFIFDVLCDRDSMEEIHRTTSYQGDNWEMKVERTEYGQIIEREIHIEKKNKFGFRYTTEYHVQKRYHLPLMIDILEYCGFTVLVKNNYGKPFHDPFHKVFTCLKTGIPRQEDK